MKTALYVKENDYLNFDTVGVMINVSMETEQIEVYFYQFSHKEQKYYIFTRLTDLMKFGMTNEGATNVFTAGKPIIEFLQSKSFDGWLIDKLERA